MRSHALTASTIFLVAALAAVFIAPRHFVWCTMMGEARLSCCCPPSSDQDSVRAPCCDARVTESAPATGTSDSGPRVHAAPPAAFVACTDAGGPGFVLGDIAQNSIEARAGPRLRPHARNSVYVI